MCYARTNVRLLRERAFITVSLYYLCVEILPVQSTIYIHTQFLNSLTKHTFRKSASIHKKKFNKHHYNTNSSLVLLKN